MWYFLPHPATFFYYLCGMENIKDIFDPWWEQLVYCVRNCKSSGRIISIEFGNITLEFHYNYDIYELVQRNELWVGIGEGPYGVENGKSWERNNRSRKTPIPMSPLESLKKSIIKELNKRGYTVE